MDTIKIRYWAQRFNLLKWGIFSALLFLAIFFYMSLTSPEATETQMVEISAGPDLRPIRHKFVAQGVREERIHIRSVEEWQTFWGRFSETTAPEVNFTQNDIIVIFMGTKGSGGYSARIGGVSLVPEGVSVRVFFCLPSRSSSQLGVLTSPYDIKLIPKVNGTVVWLVKNSCFNF